MGNCDGAPSNNKALGAVNLHASEKANATDQTRKQESEHAFSDELDAFVYILSHDIRGSVRAIKEVPIWIQEDLESMGVSMDGDIGENLHLLDQHAQRLDRMLVDLLTYSRIGRMQQVKTMDIDQVLRRIIENNGNLENFDLSLNLNHTTLEVGETDINTLISSLLSNSVKHHDKPQGQIHISSQERDGAIVLKFDDDGPGIPDEYKDRALKVMTTLKPRDECEGSGMGLAIVQKIIGTYNGTYDWIEPRFERGLGIKISLPIRAVVSL